MSPEMADRAALRIAGRCRAGRARRKAANLPSRAVGMVFPLLLLVALAAVALIETSVSGRALQPSDAPATAAEECRSPGAVAPDQPFPHGGWPQPGEYAPLR